MVEWKKLENVATYYRGVTYNKKQEVALNSGGTKILRANNITLENNSINYDDVKEIDSSVKVRNDQWLYPDDILICAGSGSKEHVGKVAFVNTELGYAFGGFMGKIVTKQNLNSRYLFHILCGSFFKDYLKIALNSTTINNLNSEIINNFLIPIPSLEEQTRIVGILDTFTSSIDNLKEQIAQRRKQYEYYRDQLLDLEGKEGVEMKSVAQFVKERILANELTAQNYTSVENLLKDKAGRKDAENIPSEGNWIKYQEGDVLIGNIRPYLKKIWLSDREGGTNGDVIVIRANDILLPKFMFYCLASESFFLYYNQALKDGKMPRGEKNRVLSYVIPSIGKEAQRRIVTILDTFESSIQNLEAQLSQREKQYEYYRNKLLTFER